MTYDQAIAECKRLFTLGIDAIPTICVFGKTDAEHIYTIRHIAYFTL